MARSLVIAGLRNSRVDPMPGGADNTWLNIDPTGPVRFGA